MENPEKMLRRALRSRRHRRQYPPEAAASRRESAVPLRPSGHASYSALMRSHDRIHSRHTGGQG